LDTDHLSALEWASGVPGQNLIARLNKLSINDVATTIISFEEQMRGWLSMLSKARSLSDQVTVYGRLNRMLDNYRKIDVLGFDMRAVSIFERLQSSRLKVGTMDLKIAAIALAHDATVLTRNLKDFNRVPRLRLENWTE